MTSLIPALLVSSAVIVAHAGVARADDAPPPIAPTAQIEAPPPWSPAIAPATSHMNSAPMVGVGTFLMIAGAATVAGGAVVVAGDCQSGWFCGLGRFVGGITIGVGIAHLIPGAIMVGVGAQQTANAPPLPVRLGVAVTPSGLALRGSF